MFFDTITIAERRSNQEFLLKVQLFEDSPLFNIHEIGEEDLEVCALLAECFPNHYERSETAMYSNLQKLKDISDVCDIGKIMKGNLIVGFMAGTVSDGMKIIPSKPYSLISLHSICIRTEYRNMGLVQKFVPQFTEEILEKRIPRDERQRNREQDHIVYGGLAVNFIENEDALISFSTYAKIGYNFWWEPCQQDITNFDMDSFDERIRIIRLENNPLSALSSMLTHHSDLNNLIGQDSSTDSSNNCLCMIKLIKSNDYYRIGEQVKSIWKHTKPIYEAKKTENDDVYFDVYDM